MIIKNIPFILFILTLTFQIFQNLYAAPRIRIHPDELRDMYVDAATVTNQNWFEIYVDDPAGDGSSSNSPIKVYIPMNSGPTQTDNFVRGALVDIPQTTDGLIRINVEVNNDTGDSRRLYAAVAGSGGTYRIVGNALMTLGTYTDWFNTKLILNLGQLCNESETTIDCAKMDSGSTLSETLKPLIYFFIGMKDDNYSAGSEIDINNYSGGIYVEASMSNRVPTNVTVTLSKLSKGDARFELHYDGETFNDFFEAFALFSTTPLGSQNVGVEVSAGASSRQFEDSKNKGSLILNKLTNGVTYYVGVGLATKYGFGTLVSNYMSDTPMEIEELLKKHSCFLLTAGFKREHKVIEGFTWFRDHILKKSFLGNIFTRGYYKYSPYFARIVYASESLSAFVRTYATILYYTVIIVVELVILGALGLLMQYIFYKKESHGAFASHH